MRRGRTTRHAGTVYCYGIFPFAFANTTPCYGLGQWGDFGVIGGVSVGVDGRIRLGIIEWRSEGAYFYVSEQAHEFQGWGGLLF